MKDQAKASCRVKTLNMIEMLDEQVQKLKVASVSDVSQERDGPHDYDPFENIEGYRWTYTWKLNPDDENTKSFVATLDEIFSVINSREALRKYPRGMYRELIEFSDKCEKRKDWIDPRYGYLTVWGDNNPTQEEVLEEAGRHLNAMVNELRKDIKAMIRSIYFYENERDETEESFIED